jgi:hypothetical protein
MEKVIYVRLIDEGTPVYRPVPSFQISQNVYKIGNQLIYNPNDEKWEFPPNTIVRVMEMCLSGNTVLVAVERLEY